jgi:hypothetical protein
MPDKAHYRVQALVDNPGKSRRLGERGRQAITARGYLWSKNASRVVRMVSPAAPRQTAVRKAALVR